MNQSHFKTSMEFISTVMILSVLCSSAIAFGGFTPQNCEFGIRRALATCICKNYISIDSVVCQIGNTTYSQLPQLEQVNKTIDNIVIMDGNITRIPKCAFAKLLVSID